MAGGMSSPSWPPAGWVRDAYSHGDHEHAFYRVGFEPGREKPRVLLLHELPGIRSTIESFVQRLSARFVVTVPSIVGRDGTADWGETLRHICIRREVHAIAAGSVSRDVEWLKDFIEKHVVEGDSPFGVIGMCFSGNFALALAVDPRVKAAVVAEPVLPLWPPALGLSRDDQRALRERDDLQVRGYRFAKDCMSPAVKLISARRLLGGARAQVTTLPGRGHSTLTADADEDALDSVETFLAERLAAATG